MRLKNKKTGEIKDTAELMYPDGIGEFFSDFDSLAELNEEWEDYEEPKEYWYIDSDGKIFCEPSDDRCKFDMACKEIGNYFETKKEAEKAVEKLKAWKRLKDAGFKFNNWIYDYREAEKENERGLSIGASYDQLSKVDAGDISLLFGGEE